ncbi:hypothetical protein ABGB18_41035 [Nonomuraea sp. B12E4]|uniref:hypothetical protein n=1 Tax=Nonomuraea sp. B12E4 TaxID=3153564 RepID=UPI00325F1CFE
MTRRLLLLIPMCVLVNGCLAQSGTTQADHDQLKVMLSQPFVRAAVTKPSARVAFQKSDRLPATRGRVTVVLARQPAADPANGARQWATTGMRQLRDSGWTVYATVCLPPRRSDDPSPPQDGAWDAWSFAAHAYKIVNGVSYFAIANGLGYVSGKVDTSIEMRVPGSQEPVSDLFPDRPPPLPVGTSCVETGELLTKKVANGPAVIMGESGTGRVGKDLRDENVR